MATKQRPADIGTERARHLIVVAGGEIRTARRDRDLSIAEVGHAVDLSGSTVSRIERGLVGRVSVADLARLHAVVGLELSVRSFPGGSPIRDAAQVDLIAEFCALMHPSLGWSTEVPLPGSGDPRAWDIVIRGEAWRTGVEAETGPRDSQALIRRLRLKQRDGHVDSVILLLRSTVQTRRFIVEAGEHVRAAFPEDGEAALARLRAGANPGDNAVIVLPGRRRVRH
jgi:transcriptional regulator with XRE-family HTH domain